MLLSRPSRNGLMRTAVSSCIAMLGEAAATNPQRCPISIGGNRNPHHPATIVIDQVGRGEILPPLRMMA